MQPKISVIVSAYQEEDYIKESIESILTQTLKEIEVVCVFRQSIDSTTEILKEYAKKDERIKLYEQIDSKGCGPAKNQGIEASVGEFITFMDADDYYLTQDCLEKLYITAKEQNVKICGGLRSYKLEDGTIVEQPLHRKLLKDFPNGRLFNYSDCQYDYHFHSYLYDRQMVINGNFRFGNRAVCDDCSFHVPIMFFAKQFYVIPVETYCYRCHEPYCWDAERTYISLSGFIEMLNFSKDNNLELLHWITVVRMSFGAFHENFNRNVVLNTDVRLFIRLVQANSCIDSSLIDRVQKNFNPDKFLGMSLPRVEKLVPQETGGYILPVILNVYSKLAKKEQELNKVYRSISFRFGRAIIGPLGKIKKYIKKIFR